MISVAAPAVAPDGGAPAAPARRSPTDPRETFSPMTGAARPAESLLARVAQGEAQAVSACVERYGALVWTVVRRVLREHALAEDVVQEVFIDLWRHAERFDPSLGSEATFVTTIARRRAIDRRRRLQRAPQVGLERPVEEIDVAAQEQPVRLDLADEARPALEVLAGLPPDQRRAILLAVVEGWTHQQISEHTGVPLGTVKSHIRRGLEKVARRLGSPAAPGGRP